jgi:hypothetical protein
LDALRASKSITINLSKGAGAGRRAPEGGGFEPREGSLPARVIEWAKGRKDTFGTKDIEKKFKLSRAHASMLLSRLANGPFPIQRERRGLYSFKG